MAEVLEFMKNALPWIAIGLFVAVSCVKMKEKKDGKASGVILNDGAGSRRLFFYILL